MTSMLIRSFLFVFSITLLGILITIGSAYTHFPRLYSLNSQQNPHQRYAFWIGDTGPTGPLFSGAWQYPFICTGMLNGLGQALVDNESRGTAIYPQLGPIPLTMLKPIGYSEACNIPTRVEYFYFNKKEQRFLPLPGKTRQPPHLDHMNLNGKKYPFIIRVERGTINRFLYSIAMPAPFQESLHSPAGLNNSAWNGRLIYKFQGGIGIGRFQGKMSFNKKHALYLAALQRGYAVAYSTGTKTGTHYNLKLAEETAVMLKEHFVATYGKPEYTIGLGASGGGIQQYIMAQNRPGLLDAAIPQASYPDMITQTIFVGDCELLERYFDAQFRNNPDSPWKDWHQRHRVEGLNFSETAVQGKWNNRFSPRPGNNGCIQGWRGSIPLIFNPKWAPGPYAQGLKQSGFPQNLEINWSHWGDLSNIYSEGKNDIVNNSWDNVGVQYGLSALRSKTISISAFLDLNACVGGWKSPKDMVLGDFPWDPSKTREDPWDQRNMSLTSDCLAGKPAPRSHASIDSIKRAFNSGQVFTGRLTIPTIDVRWYLEPVLDKHHSLASFSARARITNPEQRKLHSIWIVECSQIDGRSLQFKCDFDPVSKALDVLEQWFINKQKNPLSTVPELAPEQAVDSCFDSRGDVIYSGNNAWGDIFSKTSPSPCSARFPIYTTPRLEAGDELSGIRFKCALKPVDTALQDNTYAQVRFSPEQIIRLKKIFPEGVCDYTKPGLGNPLDFAELSNLRL
ncbi:MAG: tannase/feruloyl esterase family alpha/beta hydrolase [Gammaproteobacteria bacterium]|nr:tannase/feruloyl esterase family alpha/beta hydrolase [Gammaproteobacteria bacterium]MDH5802318.1 tannase/feruloyl esterase family alpha/beta hydrolase [Gammaproteobacteria bacterium]